MPSSLASILSRALGCSPRPPESVCGTDTKVAPRAAFPGSMGSLGSGAEAPPHHLSALMILRLSLLGPTKSAYGLELSISNRTDQPTLLRPRSLHMLPSWCRNINLLPITYASRPRLRTRLTRGRIILPQETLGLRRQGFSPCLSLLMSASSLPYAPALLTICLRRVWNALLPTMQSMAPRLRYNA